MCEVPRAQTPSMPGIVVDLFVAPATAVRKEVPPVAQRGRIRESIDGDLVTLLI